MKLQTFKLFLNGSKSLKQRGFLYTKNLLVRRKTVGGAGQVGVCRRFCTCKFLGVEWPAPYTHPCVLLGQSFPTWGNFFQQFESNFRNSTLRNSKIFGSLNQIDPPFAHVIGLCNTNPANTVYCVLASGSTSFHFCNPSNKYTICRPPTYFSFLVGHKTVGPQTESEKQSLRLRQAIRFPDLRHMMGLWKHIRKPWDSIRFSQEGEGSTKKE